MLIYIEKGLEDDWKMNIVLINSKLKKTLILPCIQYFPFFSKKFPSKISSMWISSYMDYDINCILVQDNFWIER